MKSTVLFIGAAVLGGGAIGALVPEGHSQPAPSTQPHSTMAHASAQANAGLKEIESKAEYNNRPFRDLMLTGSDKAKAEWAGANGGLCGIEPYLRYVVVENSIGKTRYDEPPDSLWNQLGCEQSAPRNQQRLLAEQAAANQQNEAEAQRFTKALFSDDPGVSNAALAWKKCQEAVWARPASTYSNVHIPTSDKSAWAGVIKAAVHRECGDMP
jgi:hypothetical protein